MQSLPQLQLQEEFRVMTAAPFFHSLNLGWAACRVNAVPPYSLDLADYGWLPNNTPIFFADKLAGHNLIVTTGGAFVDSITVTFQHEKLIVPVTHVNKQMQVVIPVRETGRVLLSASDPSFKRPMLLRVSKLLLD